jgi:hypothetical protein
MQRELSIAIERMLEHHGFDPKREATRARIIQNALTFARTDQQAGIIVHYALQIDPNWGLLWNLYEAAIQPPVRIRDVAAALTVSLLPWVATLEALAG